jgi:hypothetical protein
MELKAELNLASSRYQQMVSGERMPIPTKHQDKKEDDWLLSGIVVGNDKLPFNDSQGSISRRTLMFEYKRQLLKIKTNLDAKLADELPNLIRKCARVRYYILEWLGERDIWDEGILPDYFKQTKEHLKAETDPVTRYFTSFCTIVDPLANTEEKEEFITPLEELTNAIKAAGGKDRVKSQSTQHINEEYVKGELAKKNIKMFKIAGSGIGVVPQITKKARAKLNETERKAEEVVQRAMQVAAEVGLNDSVMSVGVVNENKLNVDQAHRALPPILNTKAQLHSVFNIKTANDISHNGIEIVVEDRSDISSIEYAGKVYTSGIFVHGLVIRKNYDDAVRELIERTRIVKLGEDTTDANDPTPISNVFRMH